eukprot:7377223-Prymnesium_polylepis.2
MLKNSHSQSVSSVRRLAHALRSRQRTPLLLGPQLTRIKAPPIVDLPVPLLWQKDEPLLPRLLIKLGIRIPRPEQRARWEDLLGPGCPPVGQPVSDPLDGAGRPDERRLVGVVLIEVLP